MTPADRLMADWPETAERQEFPKPGPRPVSGGPFDVEAFILRAGLKVRRTKDWNGGLLWELEDCPFNVEHTGGCSVITQTPEGLGFKCQHHSCADKHWVDVRTLFDGPRAHGNNRRPFGDDGQPGTGRPEPTIRTFADIPRLASVSSAPITWVVDDFLAEATVNMLTSEPGAGKTSLLTKLAHDVSLGRPFLGRATSQRPVLYLDKENPLPVTVERMARLGIADSPNFKIWGGWCPEEPPAPFSPIVIEWVRSCERKPLIIPDSFISFNPGAENDNTETRAYMNGFRHLANLGATLVLSHHTGKGETTKDYRGGSDIKASLDCAYHLANLGDPARLDRLRLRAFKSRFATVTEVLIRYVDGEFIPEELHGQPSKSNSELLAELLKANPGMRATEFEALAGDKGLGRNRARQFLQNGIAAGTIEVIRQARNVRCHFWKEAHDPYVN